MKNSEIKDLTTKEIIEKIEEEKTYLVRLRINHKVSNLDNPHKLAESKRFVARLKTELRQRELSEERS